MDDYRVMSEYDQQSTLRIKLPLHELTAQMAKPQWGSWVLLEAGADGDGGTEGAGQRGAGGVQ